MAYTTIKKSSDYFNTKLYTGNGGTNAITGVGFQPDLIWIKERSSTSSHNLVDAVRGVTKRISSDNNGVEETLSGIVSSFDSDGFTNGADNGVNENSQTYASWNWLANGSGSANTDGSITSTVSANTTAGFSIVKYTGNGTNNATFGHGLGVAPKIMIGKCTGNTNSWQVTGNVSPLVENKYLSLDTSNAMANSTNVTFDASATTIKLQGGQGTNVSGQPHIAYCFAEKTGYSKFGSYTGNGNADGTFVYTGFSPAWVMIKETSGSGAWRIFDSKRGLGGDNIGGNYKNALMADTSDVEESGATNNIIDALSNGFKLRYSFNDTNGSGGSYIYMAFAEEPLVGDNPATAR